MSLLNWSQCSDRNSASDKKWSTWQEYFDLRDQAKGAVPDEFMADRPLNFPFPETDVTICTAS